MLPSTKTYVRFHGFFATLTLPFQIGFLRKNGFFARLAVLFRLHSDNPDEVRTESDYRVVYPILYKTLPGYGIHDSVRNAPLNGPVAIQFKALHEVFMSALRAGQYDAAIRHLCYILQVRTLCGPNRGGPESKECPAHRSQMLFLALIIYSRFTMTHWTCPHRYG